MKIIVLEGIDKCGKATQTKELALRLSQAGFKTQASEFHRYDTQTGKMIQDWLFGKFECDTYTMELIMAADKQLQQYWFNELENQGYDFLILDRYTLSQEIYATYKKVNQIWLYSIMTYLKKPYAEILIDIPAELSMSRKPKYGTNNNIQDDRHEKDYNLLNSVRDLYLKACNHNHFDIKRTIIDGTQTVDNVSDDIWNYVKNLFKI
ncbi:MAG: thymidylate kinase [Sedimentibacter sp.]|nr:thymidylate kinase [Sedimentibacter sp.]